jgi:hypothetical protein
VTELDLHTDKVSNVEMGYLYEELLRKFSELSNETAGEHFTPREVMRLLVDLLFIEDNDVLETPGTVRTMLDPACGTAGMSSVSQAYLCELNPNAQLIDYGQELNAETYALVQLPVRRRYALVMLRNSRSRTRRVASLTPVCRNQGRFKPPFRVSRECRAVATSGSDTANGHNLSYRKCRLGLAVR